MALNKEAFALAEADAKSHMPAFKRLSAADVMSLYDLGDAVLTTLKDQYPEVFADENHSRRASVALRIRIEGELVPAIMHAWPTDNGTAPLGKANLLALPYEDILAYAREVRRINPFLEHLPEPTDPNPTPAAS